MAESNLTSIERSRVGEVLRRVTEPSFDQLLADDTTLRGITPDTAREQFSSMMSAAVELQAGGVKPTDSAFSEFGGPKPDTVRRFWNHVDLANLPGAQMRTAVEADLVPAPESMVVESRTEPVTGPGKFGAVHLQPPPGLEELSSAPEGAANTVGGIASVVAVADCGGLAMPVVEVPLAQAQWNPANYRPEVRRQAERALRDYAGFGGRFAATPSEIAREIVDSLAEIERCKPLDLHNPAVLVGGRMRMGFPRVSPVDFGLGHQDAYIGTDLAAISQFRDAGLPGFFELPMALRGPGHQHCDWTFAVRGSAHTLAEVEAMIDDRDTPWQEVPAAMLAGADDATLTAVTLRTTATSGATTTEVQLVYVYNAQGMTDLFVTTLMGSGATEAETTKCVVELAVAERARCRPGSAMTMSLRSLYEDGFLQRQQRRRYPDRRNFGALAQAAFGVLQLAREAA